MVPSRLNGPLLIQVALIWLVYQQHNYGFIDGTLTVTESIAIPSLDVSVSDLVAGFV